MLNGYRAVIFSQSTGICFDAARLHKLLGLLMHIKQGTKTFSSNARNKAEITRFYRKTFLPAKSSQQKKLIPEQHCLCLRSR